MRRRLNNRYIEIQEQLTDTLVKFSNIEKAKLKLQSQHEVLLDDYEKVGGIIYLCFLFLNNQVKIKF